MEGVGGEVGWRGREAEVGAVFGGWRSVLLLLWCCIRFDVALVGVWAIHAVVMGTRLRESFGAWM